MKTNKYIILLINPETEKAIFLAKNSNIKNICYQENPKLPGTNDINKAKYYQTVEDAKKDIYLLKYHFRFMLQLKYVIIDYDQYLTLNEIEVDHKRYLLRN